MIKKWDKLVEKAAKQIYDGLIKSGDVNPDMIKAQADFLFKGIEKGYGKKITSVTGDDLMMMEALRENIYYFSGFKNLQQMKETTSLLLDDNGKIRPFKSFLNDVKKVDQTYNQFYLQSEYKFAIDAAQGISHWQRVQAEKDTLPLLRWSAVHDGHTRESHMILDGTCLPVVHPFWLTHWIPLEWGCRCDISQEGPHVAIQNPPTNLPKRDPFFNYNPGADKVIFPLDKDRFANIHPYADNTNDKERETVRQAVEPLIPIGKINSPEDLHALISEYAKTHPEDFYRGFKEVRVIKNQRSKSNAYTDCRGSITVVDVNSHIPDPFNPDKYIVYNPYKCLISGLQKIQAGKQLEFVEENAFRTLYHEILHNKASKPDLFQLRGTDLVRNMEIANEYIARQQYHKLIEAFGGKARFQNEIYTHGSGYGVFLKGWNLIVERLQFDVYEVTQMMEDAILKDSYLNVGDNVAKFISQKTGKSLRDCKMLYASCKGGIYSVESRLKSAGFIKSDHP